MEYPSHGQSDTCTRAACSSVARFGISRQDCILSFDIERASAFERLVNR